MMIEWKTGRPEKEGDYVVVTVYESVNTWHFTPEYGWNTHWFHPDSSIPDETVVAWAENFAPVVIDIYGHGDIMEETEGC